MFKNLCEQTMRTVFTLIKRHAMKRLSKVYTLWMGFTSLNHTAVKQNTQLVRTE